MVRVHPRVKWSGASRIAAGTREQQVGDGREQDPAAGNWQRGEPGLDAQNMVLAGAEHRAILGGQRAEPMGQGWELEGGRAGRGPCPEGEVLRRFSSWAVSGSWSFEADHRVGLRLESWRLKSSADLAGQVE